MSVRARILVALSGGDALSSREIAARSGLARLQVDNCIWRCWRQGYVLRTAEAVHVVEVVRRGRGGSSVHNRPHHLYLLRAGDVGSVVVGGRRFVEFDPVFLDPRGGGNLSKSLMIRDFLSENCDRAWFSRQVADRLADRGVRIVDIMSNVRRFERNGLVYVRGYKTDERETPFQEGYLLTWLDQDTPRDRALAEAVERSDAALAGRDSSSPIVARIQRVRDVIVEHTLLRRLVGSSFITHKLGCGPYEAEHALRRAMQLYPDIRVVKLFDAYNYYYLEGFDVMDFDAAVEMKKNYIRKTQGAVNRVGHNWEAVAEWFIDKTTTGARFWTQKHRSRMDSKRITLHLLKGVGGRRRAAEVDRVWEVTPGVFAPPITYVLSCKWGLVNRKHVDDFIEVMKWSKSFGVDTPDGRDLKQGVVGVFAASSFNPRETVQLKDHSRISLSQYTERRNLQLVTAAEFNKMLRERGCGKEATVQKVCRASRDEAEVRETLFRMWDKPAEAMAIISEARRNNTDLFDFERMLEA